MMDNRDSDNHPPFDTAIADALLARLEADDDYRQLFANNPVEALAIIGYAPAQASETEQKFSFSCMKVNKLASKEEIGTARLALRSYLTADPHTVVFSFEDGEIERRIKRK